MSILLFIIYPFTIINIWVKRKIFKKMLVRSFFFKKFHHIPKKCDFEQKKFSRQKKSYLENEHMMKETALYVCIVFNHVPVINSHGRCLLVVWIVGLCDEALLDDVRSILLIVLVCGCLADVSKTMTIA